MPRKENQRIALTRRLLQEGMLRLLAQKKLEDISVTALCKESGINRATFYNHYTSPAQVLEEMEKALVEKLLQLSPPAKSIEEVLDQTEKCCAHLQENAALFHVLVRYHVDGDLENMIISIVQHYDEHRMDISKTNMDHDTKLLVTSYLYAGCYALIREWLILGIDKSPREIAQLLVSIVSKDYL